MLLPSPSTVIALHEVRFVTDALNIIQPDRPSVCFVHVADVPAVVSDRTIIKKIVVNRGKGLFYPQHSFILSLIHSLIRSLTHSYEILFTK